MLPRGGCAIYARRPAACSGYRCSWLTGVVGNNDERPDTVGLVANPGSALYADGPPLMLVVEVKKGSLQVPSGKAFVARMVASGWIVRSWSILDTPIVQYHVPLTGEASATGIRLGNEGGKVHWIDTSGILPYPDLTMPLAA